MLQSANVPDKQHDYFKKLTIKGCKSTLDVNYRATLTFNCEGNVPDGYTVKWSNGQTGKTCILEKLENGTKVSCWLEKDGVMAEKTESDEKPLT